MGWYPTVVLTFISIICDLVNHFMCLLATCISSLQKCLFKLFAHFWIRLFVLHCWVLNFFYIFCILNWYQIYDFQIFSHSMSHLFNYVVSVFSCPAQIFKIFMKYNVSIFFFDYLWCYTQEINAKSNVVKFLFQECHGFRCYIYIFDPLWVNLCM